MSSHVSFERLCNQADHTNRHAGWRKHKEIKKFSELILLSCHYIWSILIVIESFLYVANSDVIERLFMEINGEVRTTVFF